jgi:hypothetical protein
MKPQDLRDVRTNHRSQTKKYTQWGIPTEKTRREVVFSFYPAKHKAQSRRSIGVRTKSLQNKANSLQQYKEAIQNHIQNSTQSVLQQEELQARVQQFVIQTISLLFLLINTFLIASIIFLLLCIPSPRESQTLATMSFQPNQDAARRREGYTAPIQNRDNSSAYLHPDDPLGQETTTTTSTPVSSETEALTNPDFRHILQAIANGVGMMARDNQRTYVNERAPFADVSLLFNGENVTFFIKEIEQRSSFYQWTIEDRISRLLSHCDHVRRDIIESSMTDFIIAKANNDWQGIRTALRKRFRSLDQAQREETEDSLRAWCLSCSLTTNLSLQSYLDSFGPRFNRCLEAGTVVPAQKGFFLARGLNRERLNKVLNKFDLSISNPGAFQYEQIGLFLSKMAFREAEIEAFNPALAKNSHVVKTTASNSSLGPLPTVTFRAPQLDPNAVLRPTQTTQRPQGERGVQMPPGHEPTQSEVDDLIEKFTRIKLSGMNLSTAPQEPRESELLAYPDVQQDIGAALAQVRNTSHTLDPRATARTFPSQPQSLSHPRPSFQQNLQPLQPYNSQQPQGDCYACGKTGHIARFCDQKDALIKNRWIHTNQQGRLSWGTQEDPKGEVRNVPGTHIIGTIVEGIKNQLKARGEPVVDPLTTINPYEKRPQGRMGVSSNIIVIDDGDSQASGLMEEEVFMQILETAEMDTKNEELVFASAHVASAGLANPAKSSCQLGTSAIKPITSHTPTVRNNKNQDADWIRPKAVSFDEDMELDNDSAGPLENPSKATPRKHRVIDALQNDPDKMVRQVLGTTVSVPLKDLLAIAPELQKRLSKPYYTAEGLETLLNAQGIPQTAIGAKYHVNNMTLSCPEYIHIEARNGFITRAGSRSSNTNKARVTVPVFPRN